jgi:hypothetical protein
MKKKTESRITERKTKKIGFVVYGLSPKIGGKTKSLLLGGTNSSPSARKLYIERTRTPHEVNGLFFGHTLCVNAALGEIENLWIWTLLAAETKPH